MSRSISFACTAALLITTASAALGQTTRLAAVVPRADAGLGAVEKPVALCCLSRLTAEEAARITADLEQASAFTVEGRMTEARRLLRDVVEKQERGDAYPGVALRMLANVEFGLNRPIVAAGILVRLADVAAQAGDPATEFEALLDAAVLYQQAGRIGMVRELRPRVRSLANSPAIPEALRQSVAHRLVPE